MEQSCPGTVLPWNILTLVQSCPDSPTWFSSTLVHSSLARPGLVQSNTATVLPWYSPTLVQSHAGTFFYGSVYTVLVLPWYMTTMVQSYPAVISRGKIRQDFPFQWDKKKCPMSKMYIFVRYLYYKCFSFLLV